MRVSRFNDERTAYAAYRQIRHTWMLMLASTLALCALPLLFQLLHDEVATFPPTWRTVETSFAPTTVYEWLFWWLPYVAASSCAALVLAAVLPRSLHRWWLSRFNLHMIEGALGQVATYRHPPQRQFMADPCDIHRLAYAYGARLAGVASLLVVAAVHACDLASPVFGNHPPTVTFVPVEGYFPLFILPTLILLGNAPTSARFFGPHTTNAASSP